MTITTGLQDNKRWVELRFEGEESKILNILENASHYIYDSYKDIGDYGAKSFDELSNIEKRKLINDWIKREIKRMAKDKYLELTIKEAENTAKMSAIEEVNTNFEFED